MYESVTGDSLVSWYTLIAMTCSPVPARWRMLWLGAPSSVTQNVDLQIPGADNLRPFVHAEHCCKLEKGQLTIRSRRGREVRRPQIVHPRSFHLSIVLGLRSFVFQSLNALSIFEFRSSTSRRACFFQHS